MGEAGAQAAHQLGGRRDSRQQRQGAVDALAVDQAGADPEPGAGVGRRLPRLAGGDGAGPDHRALDLAGDAADALEGGRRAQGDLQRMEPAGRQRPGQRHGLGGVLDDQDRHHRGELEGLGEGHSGLPSSCSSTRAAPTSAA